MTDDEINRKVGEKVRRYSDNEKAIVCLDDHLRDCNKNLDCFLRNTEDLASQTAIADSPDPREKVVQLVERIGERSEIKAFLRIHGVEQE